MTYTIAVSDDGKEFFIIRMSASATPVIEAVAASRAAAEAKLSEIAVKAAINTIYMHIIDFSNEGARLRAGTLVRFEEDANRVLAAIKNLWRTQEAEDQA